MQYNTSKKEIYFREYGRNIQELVEHLFTIEDQQKRQSAAEGVVSAMMTLSPSTDFPEEHRLKVWSHLLHMCEYKLDLVPPGPIVKHLEGFKPEKIEYPTHRIKYKHYGWHVSKLIQKAKDTEDPEAKLEFAENIGAFMKMQFRTWNRDNVEDKTILKDLAELSDGGIVLDGTANFEHLAVASKKTLHLVQANVASQKVNLRKKSTNKSKSKNKKK